MSEEDINFLISIQDLEQPEFDNACLERENERLKNQLQQKENIIKKAIEYVKTKNYCSDIFTKDFAIFDKQELLEILDKGGEK